MGLLERERRRGVQSSHWEETVRGRRCPPTDRWELPHCSRSLGRSLKEMMGSLPKDSGQGLAGLSGGRPTPVSLSLPLSSHH